jgi:hypothetical protein
MMTEPIDFNRDCVPYALHILSEIDYERVCQEARSFGWSDKTGISHSEVIPFARHLGIQLTLFDQIYIDGKLPTLKKIIPCLSSSKSYLLRVNEHVMAVCNGIIHDKADTHPRTVVNGVAEVVHDLSDIIANDDEWKLLCEDFRKSGRPLSARCSLNKHELSLNHEYFWAISKLAEIRGKISA